MKRPTDGMVVLISGASAGIGRSVAEIMSARGAKLVLLARRAELLDSLNQQLGGNHLTVTGDVSVAGDCAAAVETTVAHFGRIDTLVCNAGFGLAKSIADTTEAEWQSLFQTNVMGTVSLIRAAIPMMAKQPMVSGWRGQVVVVTSAVARRGLPFSGAYCATKAAQLSLAEAMRVELKPQRIAVTSVHPVGTATEFFKISAERGAAVPPAGESLQSPDVVARKIVKAIEKPRPEVWPKPSARLGISIGTLMPGLVDRALRDFRRPPETEKPVTSAAVSAND